jgi:hypothetical protein
VKIIYVCSPLRGDISGNIRQRARERAAGAGRQDGHSAGGCGVFQYDGAEQHGVGQNRRALFL